MNTTRMLESSAVSMTQGSTARSRAIHSLALVILVLLVLGHCAGHEFVNFDDDKLIAANPKLVPPTFSGLAAVWRGPDAHLYIPVVYTAWWLLAALGLVSNGAGGYTVNPWVFHSANLLLHVVNVLLVRRIARAIVHDDLAATLGAGVFAVHPLQIEAVAWATGMKDLLCGLFSLLAIVSAIGAAGPHDDMSDEPSPSSPAKTRWVLWQLALVCCAAALLSKPSAVTLPIIAAIVIWMTGSTRRQRWLVILIGLILAVPIVLVTRSAQEAIGVPSISLWMRPLIATDALAFYVAKLFWPFELAVDYGRTPSSVIASGAVYWTWIIPIVVTALVLWSRRRILIGAWAIFVAGVAANLGLLAFQYQVFSTVADRYVYLSMLGVAVAIAWIVHHGARPARVKAAIMVLIAALGLVAFVQAGQWRDSQALWRHTIAVNPRSALAYVNLGATMLEENDVTGSMSMLNHAVAIDPHDSFAWLNLTRARLRGGDTAGAAQSALLMAQAYRERKDFNPELTAAVLERFAQAIRRQGDAKSADRLLETVKTLRESHQPRARSGG